MKTISITNEEILRSLKGDSSIISEELFKGEESGHKYKAGEIRTLSGLTSFPEYNGEKVEITSIREDGPWGKAYYIEGRINEVMNWVYESRLS